MRKTTKRLVSFLTAAIMAVSMLPSVGAANVLSAEYDNDDNAIIVSGLTTGVDVQTIKIEDLSDDIIAMEEYRGAEVAAEQTIPVLETIAAGLYDVTVSFDGVVDTCQVEVTPGVKAIYNATAGTVRVINIPASEGATTIEIVGTSTVAMEEYDNVAAERTINVLPLANGTYTVSVGVVKSGTAEVSATTFVVTGSTATPAPTTAPTEAPTETPTVAPTATPVPEGKVDVPAVDASKLIYSYTMNDGTYNLTAGSYTSAGVLKVYGGDAEHGSFEVADGLGGKSDKVLKVTRNAESGAYPVRITGYSGDVGTTNTVTAEVQVYVPTIPTGAGMSMTVYTNAASDSDGTRMQIGYDKDGKWTANAHAEGAKQDAEWSRVDGASMAGKWHNLAIEITKATSASAADGSFKAYLNGELVLTVSGLQINTVKADTRVASSYVSANAATGVVQYFDNLRMYEGAYIGQEPVATVAPTTAPTEAPTAEPGLPAIDIPAGAIIHEYYFDDDDNTPWANGGTIVAGTEAGKAATDRIYQMDASPSGEYFAGYDNGATTGKTKTTLQFDVYISADTAQMRIWGAGTSNGNLAKNRPGIGIKNVDGTMMAGLMDGWNFDNNVGTLTTEVPVNEWVRFAIEYDVTNSLATLYMYDGNEMSAIDTMAMTNHTSTPCDFSASNNDIYMDNVILYDADYSAPTEAPTAAPSEAPTTTPIPTDTPLDEDKLAFYFPFDSLDEATRLVDPASSGNNPPSIETSIAGRTSSVAKIRGGNANGGVGTWGQVWTDESGNACQVFTVEALVYNPNGTSVYIYPTNGGAATTNNRLGVKLQGDGTLEYMHNSWTGVDTGVDYNPNQWNKVAYTVNCNDQTLKIYLNENLVYTYESDIIDSSGFGKDIRFTPSDYIYVDNFLGYAGEYGSAIDDGTSSPAPSESPSELPTTDPSATPTPTPEPTPTPTPTPTPKPLPTQRPSGGSPSGSTPSATRPTQSPAGNGGYVGILPTEAPKFQDMAGFEWAEPAVNALAYAGVVNGRTDTTFDPASPVTRAEFTKMVCGAMGLQAKNGAAQVFTDVPATHWAYGYIATAAELGIVNGVTDTEFMPNDLITREQMAAILYRAIVACGFEAKLPDGTAVAFADYDAISDYAKAPVDALSAAGVINGVTDTTFVPAATANRAQAASILYQYFQAIG